VAEADSALAVAAVAVIKAEAAVGVLSANFGARQRVATKAISANSSTSGKLSLTVHCDGNRLIIFLSPQYGGGGGGNGSFGGGGGSFGGGGSPGGGGGGGGGGKGQIDEEVLKFSPVQFSNDGDKRWYVQQQYDLT